MKKRNIKILSAFVVAITMLTACSDDFLDRPPLDGLVDENYYKTDAQILAGTAPLYSAAWKTYVDKANFKLGDIRGGTVFRAWNDRDAVEFNITDVSEANEQAYQAFYVVIGQANLIIHNIKTFAGPEVSEAVKNHAFAEARFMRATAYMHLVMNYGPVPIIENNLDYLDNPGKVRTNPISDVWEFIRRDYEFAAANLPELPVLPGRVTRWSAEGMLARTHLTMAGIEAGGAGSRDPQHLAKAKEYAQRVIMQSGKSLLSDYEKLFLYPYDNGVESLFELQWVFSLDPQSGYDAANTMVSQITFSNDVAANGDGWGGDLGASWWMLSLYDGLMNMGDPADSTDDGQIAGFTLDRRLKASFMLPGFTYPELITPTGPLVFPNPTDENSFASIKKYVVGKAGGEADRQRYPNNTYMLRLAEMYLIYAEACLNNGDETNDPIAIEYYDIIRHRAGLPPLEDPNTPEPEVLTLDLIYKERAKEFAMESMFWYDLVRLHYYNAQKAYDIINKQDRGTYVIRPNQWPNPTAWTFTRNTWVATRTADASSANFLLPLPSSEANQAPSLLLEPVPYVFND